MCTPESYSTLICLNELHSLCKMSLENIKMHEATIAYRQTETKLKERMKGKYF